MIWGLISSPLAGKGALSTKSGQKSGQFHKVTFLTDDSTQREIMRNGVEAQVGVCRRDLPCDELREPAAGDFPDGWGPAIFSCGLGRAIRAGPGGGAMRTC